MKSTMLFRFHIVSGSGLVGTTFKMTDLQLFLKKHFDFDKNLWFLKKNFSPKYSARKTEQNDRLISTVGLLFQNLVIPSEFHLDIIDCNTLHVKSQESVAVYYVPLKKCCSLLGPFENVAVYLVHFRICSSLLGPFQKMLQSIWSL